MRDCAAPGSARRIVDHPDGLPKATWTSSSNANGEVALAAGEAPSACRGMRTRRAPGLDSNTKGGLSIMASPSTPTSTGAPESTWNRSALHSSHPGEPVDLADGIEGTICCASAALFDPQAHDARACPRPAAPVCPDRSPVESVRIVGDQQHVRAGLLLPVGAGEAQVERLGVRAEQVGQHVEHGLHLGVAVLGRLHDLRVEPHRGVVHERRVPLTVGQVDPPLDAVGVGVERTDDVVAVQPQVQREVVPGAGGDHDMRDVMLARDRGHQRLGAVAAGHADHVGAARDGVLGQREQVVARRQHDGLDPALDRHSSSRWNFSTLPPPDRGFMISTGVPAGGADGQRRHGGGQVLAPCDASATRPSPPRSPTAPRS